MKIDFGRVKRATASALFTTALSIVCLLAIWVVWWALKLFIAGSVLVVAALILMCLVEFSTQFRREWAKGRTDANE